MSDIRHCDRCGRARSSWLFAWLRPWKACEYQREINTPHKQSTRIDFCSDCRDAFEKFMKEETP